MCVSLSSDGRIDLSFLGMSCRQIFDACQASILPHKRPQLLRDVRDYWQGSQDLTKMPSFSALD